MSRVYMDSKYGDCRLCFLPPNATLHVLGTLLLGPRVGSRQV